MNDLVAKTTGMDGIVADEQDLAFVLSQVCVYAHVCRCIALSAVGGHRRGVYMYMYMCIAGVEGVVADEQDLAFILSEAKGLRGCKGL